MVVEELYQKEAGLGSRLVAAWDYMYRDAGRRLEFYLLWLARCRC